MMDATNAKMPLPSKLHLTHVLDNPLRDPSKYRQLVGNLNFLLYTRPEIAFCFFFFEYLSQFNQTPCQAHYDASLHVLKYLLKESVTQGLHFNKSS